MSTATAGAEQPELRRAIGPAHLFCYALGGMLGAGIYGLIGRAAGELGSAVWLGFALAMPAALLTGLSYAALGARFPHAGGAATVMERVFGRRLLTWVVGLAVMASGLTSVATQSRVVAENVLRLVGLDTLPAAAIALGFLALIAGVVLRGIRESMWLNVVCTVVEATGVLLVIAVGARYWGSVPLFESPSGGLDAALLAQGVILTFFAFIGFEDVLNVAEETRSPARTLPLGLIAAMLVVTVLYIGVAVTAVSVVPWRELAAAPGPLAEVMGRAAPWFPEAGFVAITIFAVANTALLNYVTASRLALGMARHGLLPAAIGRVHPRFRTPHVAIAALFAVVVVLMLAGNIGDLAAATVLLLLGVFVAMNLALVAIKRRRDTAEAPGFDVPLFVPVLGAAICFVLLAARVVAGDWRAPAIAAALLAAILAGYALLRPGGRAE